MKLTASRKVYLTLLGLAVTAFAVDRLFLSPGQTGPEQVQAVSVAPPASPLPQPAPGTPAASATVPSVAARLTELAQREDLDPARVPEAFAPPKSWTIQAATSQAAKANATLAFAQKHRLTAVIRSTNRTGVVVDSTMISIGEEIDGFRLVSTTKRSAFFESVEEAEWIELRLESPAQP